MSDSTINILDYVQDAAQIARRCPTTTLVRAFSQAARRFCIESRWYVVNVPGLTQPLQGLYQLGDDPYVEVINIRSMAAYPTDGSATSWPVNPLDGTAMSPLAKPGAPTRYTYVPRANFALYPVPDKEYNLVVGIQCAPKEGATKLPVELLQFTEAFTNGALGYLLKLGDTAWENPRLAAEKEQAFKSAISNAKADAQRGYNTGTVMARPRRVF